MQQHFTIGEISQRYGGDNEGTCMRLESADEGGTSLTIYFNRLLDAATLAQILVPKSKVIFALDEAGIEQQAMHSVWLSAEGAAQFRAQEATISDLKEQLAAKG